MRSLTASRALVPGLGLIIALCGACSLTYQSVYEGDVRFEHCYRLDEERQVAIGDKRVCWHDWSQKYTYGQTRDRIEYALARERTLGQAQASGERSAPPGVVTPAANANVSPQPTSAFAPPPPTMSRDAGADAERQTTVAALVQSGSGVTAPGATCGVNCGKTWVACGEQCKGTACQSGCDDRYKSCMRACF